MSKAANKYVVPRCKAWHIEGLVPSLQPHEILLVDAADYARLEQECKDAKCQAELMQRAAEVFRDDRAAAIKQVEELRDLLRKIAPHFSAPRGLGGLHDEIDAALSAKQ